jgi:hypothetical protein
MRGYRAKGRPREPKRRDPNSSQVTHQDTGGYECWLAKLNVADTATPQAANRRALRGGRPAGAHSRACVAPMTVRRRAAIEAVVGPFALRYGDVHL